MAGNIRRNRNNELLSELEAVQRALVLQAVVGPAGLIGPPGGPGEAGDEGSTGPQGARLDPAALSAVTRVGGNTTEATTTSTTAVDLLAASSLSLGITPFMMCHQGRKTTGAAAAGSLGVKLNTTQVKSNAARFSTNNQAEALFVSATWGLITATYHQGIYVAANIQQTAGVIQMNADAPNATITSVVVTALTADALVTVGADALHVYTYAVS